MSNRWLSRIVCAVVIGAGVCATIAAFLKGDKEMMLNAPIGTVLGVNLTVWLMGWP